MDENQLIKAITEKVEILHKLITSDKNNDDAINYIPSINFKFNTVIKPLGCESAKEFKSIINEILNFNKFNEVYSTKYVKKEITTILHKTLNKYDDIKPEIEQFCTTLIKNSNHEWFIISEIENIKLLNTNMPFHLIDCTIKCLSEKDIPFDIKRTEIGIFNLSESIMKPCIFTTVSAGDSEKARILALERFSNSLNLLRIYFPHFKPTLKGTLRFGMNQIYSFNKATELIETNSSLTGHPLLEEAYLDEELYTWLQQSGIKELKINNKITNIVKQCLHWLEIGLNEDLQSAKLLHFTTILESTLKLPSESTELKQRVSDRCALLLSSTY
ncbi:hypothetical protein [Methanococcoides burtonii]|nr:hypothetical protein [Methanococcoides burtonii]